ncbi:MAG: quinone-dependent dihydroorotate dehydrogenase [Flavobacteriales bacterium]|jgi:dihydroorotate dehydrogenase
MFKLFRFFLFFLPPERAHYSAVFFIRLVDRIPYINSFLSRPLVNEKLLSTSFLGLEFQNPIGLAAGFDKDATCFSAMGSLGFGFVEIGTVTPKPQAGNEKPRLFRIKKDEALINRMGFNNLGVDEARKRLLKANRKGLIIGGNIGKNKWTPNAQATEDYLYCFRTLYDCVDYFVVNVSSPNTQQLRELQEKEPLIALLNALNQENEIRGNKRPILLKIAPDLSLSQLDDIIEVAKLTRLSGIVATNTTIERIKLSISQDSIHQMGNGGLSGKPVRDKSTAVISYLSQKTNGTLPIIGVGGIHSKEDAMEKLAAGATLIQLYTGFIYEGPPLIKDIKRAIIAHRKDS